MAQSPARRVFPHSRGGQTMRIVCVILGSISLGLGIIGLLLPLVPTTPFLLLSAACYARGSEKFHSWLLNHRWFGSYLRDYLSGAGIPLKAKVSAIVLIWISIAVTGLFVVTLLWARIVLIVIASGITLYLIYLPTQRKDACAGSGNPTGRSGSQ